MEEKKKLSAERLAELREQLKRENEALDAAKRTNAPSDQTEQERPDAKVVTVKIAEDVMSASVTLAVPLGNAVYSAAEIIAELRANKVVLGIQSDVIMDMVNLGIYEEETVVAVGQEVVPGVEGYYEFFVDMEVRTTPEIREDGTVDYSSVGKLTNIAEGDRIAAYHPAVQGTKGYNVCGAELSPKYAKELPVLRGKYIRHDDDMVYYATRDGKISYAHYNVEILNVYEINDDITLNYGTVEFYGDIVINGNVETGSVIRAGRNITINGTVANARISAGGDIVLARGVQGAGLGHISTRGNIFAEFIEYANVEASQNVFANYILDSKISSGGKVYVDGSHGSIIGGTTRALLGVELKNAGTQVEQRTVIHVGFDEDDYLKFAELTKEEKRINAELASGVAELTELLKIGRERGVTSKQKERIFELNKQKDTAYEQLDKISEGKKELGERMARAAGASIIVRGEANRNTVISIDTASLVIQKTETYLKYVCKNDVIVRKTI